MNKHDKDDGGIREAVAVFHEAQALKQTVGQLEQAGFDNAQMGLLAAEHTVRESLGDFYECVNRGSAEGVSPETAFVGRQSVDEGPRSMGGSLFFVGTAGTMGAVVASAAVLGGSLLAATGGIAAVGAVGALVGAIIHQDEAQDLEQEVGAGHILLFVRLDDEAREREVLDILSAHAQGPVKVLKLRRKAA